jgi:hypothetical protein
MFQWSSTIGFGKSNLGSGQNSIYKDFRVAPKVITVIKELTESDKNNELVIQT